MRPVLGGTGERVTNREIAIEHARICRRWSLFLDRIATATAGRKTRHYNRPFDLWWHYRKQASKHLPEMTVRQQLEALGWTRKDGETVRRSDGAKPAYVPCHPSVCQVQQWVLSGCPAAEKARAA
jgi:hypothetical protein